MTEKKLTEKPIIINCDGCEYKCRSIPLLDNEAHTWCHGFYRIGNEAGRKAEQKHILELAENCRDWCPWYEDCHTQCAEEECSLTPFTKEIEKLIRGGERG